MKKPTWKKLSSTHATENLLEVLGICVRSTWKVILVVLILLIVKGTIQRSHRIFKLALKLSDIIQQILLCHLSTFQVETGTGA